VAQRARFNLAAVALTTDEFAEAIEHVNQGLALARERGDRVVERQMLSQLAPALSALGRWDELTNTAGSVLEGQPDSNAVIAAAFLALVSAARGDEATMDRCLELAAPHRDSTYVDLRICAMLIFARDALERGDAEPALKLARDSLDLRGTGIEFTEEAYAQAVEAALALGEEGALTDLEAFVAALPPARATPLLRAGRTRLGAEIAHRSGDTEGTSRLEQEAIRLLRSVGARPLLAAALLDRARRRGDAEALAEARAIYSELAATRWLERIDQRSEVTA
jgi:tetratricopeptide (TPR) repeat protein